ncbi:cytidine deaminase [Adhaeribacter soli]|uniref:Cytidine deaminase n=1 Tax=Adhaeribacter soli TaxID=2607655 RepID=A0A5N1J296_9BACT|nr:cytidine deaminase [Adhaeribacter soli]KAA9340626.1 cytidine deaminase [Adhaeribacter soli]
MARPLNINISIEVLTSENELTAPEKRAWDKAKEATNNAYAPYSNFLVGAALLLEDGTIHIGNNQENAAYPSGLCAERTALFGKSAVLPDMPIELIAVAARKAGTEAFLCGSPCGGCRQVMTEYENRQGKPIKILLQGKGTEIYRLASVSDLLPMQFSKMDLLG